MVGIKPSYSLQGLGTRTLRVTDNLTLSPFLCLGGHVTVGNVLNQSVPLFVRLSNG